MRNVGALLVLAVAVTLAACVGGASTTAPGTTTVPGTSALPLPTVPGTSAPATTLVRGSATAGPVCPVERPGDSSCAPRPVVGATIVVTRQSGAEVARATTMADGSFSVDLPPGDYVLVPQPVEGLMGTAEPIAVSVAANGSPLPSPVVIQYDTGIR
jgi:hypothetical protein